MIYIYKYTHTHTHTHTRIHDTHTRIHVHIYTYTHIHIYIFRERETATSRSRSCIRHQTLSAFCHLTNTCMCSKLGTQCVRSKKSERLPLDTHLIGRHTRRSVGDRLCSHMLSFHPSSSHTFKSDTDDAFCVSILYFCNSKVRKLSTCDHLSMSTHPVNREVILKFTCIS